MKKEIILLCFILMSHIVAISQADLLSTRIQEIEAKEITKEREHQLRLKEINLQAEQVLAKQKNELLRWFLGIMGMGTIFGIAASVFWLPNLIRKRVEKEVDEKIGEAIRGRSTTVRSLLRQYDDEASLLKNKKIYFYNNQTSEAFTNFLIQLGFSEQSFVDNIQDSDLVFINNENSYLKKIELRGKTKEEIEELLNQEANTAWRELRDAISKNKKKCFFYYNSKGILFPSDIFSDMVTSARINFTTNPAQMYGNLINSLKYHSTFVE